MAYRYLDEDGCRKLAEAVLKDAIETYQRVTDPKYAPTSSGTNEGCQRESVDEVTQFFADSELLDFWLDMAGARGLRAEDVQSMLGIDIKGVPRNPEWKFHGSERDFCDEWDYVAQGSICGLCQRAADGCEWSRFFKPVDGWIASESVVNTRGYALEGTQGYKVYRCPKFKPDNPKEHLGQKEWQDELCDTYVKLFEDAAQFRKRMLAAERASGAYRNAITKIKEQIKSERFDFPRDSAEYRLLTKLLDLAKSAETTAVKRDGTRPDKKPAAGDEED